MNQKQAIAKLSKLIGPTFGYRVDPKAPDAEQREALHAAWAEAKARRDAAAEVRDARRAEVLRADAEYQRLKGEAAAAEAALERAGAGRWHYRVSVGRCSKLFFSVVAEGDNWQEVVDKATNNAAIL